MTLLERVKKSETITHNFVETVIMVIEANALMRITDKEVECLTDYMKKEVLKDENS